MIPQDVRVALDEILRAYEDTRDYDSDLYHTVNAWMSHQPQMPMPDWSQAPEWAQWWAVDANGDSHWYSGKPFAGNIAWINADDYLLYAGRTGYPLGIDWRQTLTQRPQQQEEQG